MDLHEQSLLSASHQRTPSRTDPHTHDAHFSLPSLVVLQPARPIAEPEPDKARCMDFLLQKWKQACSCHLNVSPSRKRPESVAHDRYGRKDRPGDRGTARGATPVAKLAQLIVLSFEANFAGMRRHETDESTKAPTEEKCNEDETHRRNPLACRETLRRMRGTPIQQCTERPWLALEHSFSK